MLKSAAGMLAKPGVLKDVFSLGSGLFKSGIDWPGGFGGLSADTGSSGFDTYW